jgi:hypothetical protein
MVKKKKGPAARPAAAKSIESDDDTIKCVETIESVDPVIEPSNEVVESEDLEPMQHDLITNHLKARDSSPYGHTWPNSSFGPQILKSGNQQCLNEMKLRN